MKRLLFALLFATPVLGQSVSIPIQNPSFEQVTTPFNPDPVTCGYRAWNYGAAALPGWTFYNATLNQIWGGGAETFTAPCNLPPPPDGKNAAWVEGQNYIVTMYQDTGVVAGDIQKIAGVPSNGIYTMRFYVANVFGVYPSYYEAKIFLGAQELCETDGWATADYEQGMLICLSPRYLVFDQWPTNVPTEPPIGQFDYSAHIIVSFGSSGWPLLVDKISLTYTLTTIN